MKGWGYAVMLGLGILILSLWSSNKALRSDNNRLQGNNEALMEEVVTYMDIADRSAASVQMLELKKSEEKLPGCLPEGGGSWVASQTTASSQQDRNPDKGRDPDRC